MSGNRRITVGNIAQSGLKGKAMSDALASALNAPNPLGETSKPRTNKRFT